MPRLADTLTELARPGRRRPGLPAEVARLTALVTGRGSCRHPHGTSSMIRSSLAPSRPTRPRTWPATAWLPEPTVTNARLHIDWTACDGRGLCAEPLPELLTEDDWGYPRARDGAPEQTVPRALERNAERAVDHCPALALRLLR